MITNKLKNIHESSTEYKELLRKSNFIASDLAKEASKHVEDAYNLIQRLRTREVIPLIKFQEISESLKNCSNRLERFQEKINKQFT